MREPEFQINEQEFQEFQALVQRLETAETDDFFELAAILGRNSKTDLSGADLSGTGLSGADLRGADLSGTDLNGTDLSGADLRGADLSRTDLNGADLSGADLRGADLSRTDLNGADLSGADLRGADLSGTDLNGTDLSGADLRGADLSSADLNGTDLSGATLTLIETTNETNLDSERKQAEETHAQVLRDQAARREAEAADRMKDEFLAVLSHELRTPVNSMLGWSRLLRTRQFDEATTARALETIERNALAQAQLIDDILDVSQIVHGKLRLTCHALNLLTVAEAAIKSVRPMLESKAIRLESFLDPTVGQVWGDSERLRQVIWNLLTNAIKFTPNNGLVTVHLSVVATQEQSLSATERSNTRYAQLKVIDTGSGISPEFLPYVFERFRQADRISTRTQNSSGLGLGLAIARQLVEQHGGSIRAESLGIDQGATFTITLPLLELETGVNAPDPLVTQLRQDSKG